VLVAFARPLETDLPAVEVVVIDALDVTHGARFGHGAR
jgi:hypothetical protein